MRYIKVTIIAVLLAFIVNKAIGKPEVTLVKDIVVGLSNSQPQYLTVFNGKIYFGTVFASGLWMSDGTESGTVKADDSSINFDFPSELVLIDNELYFNTFSNPGWWSTSGGSNNSTLIINDFNVYAHVMYTSNTLMQDVLVLSGRDFSIVDFPNDLYRSDLTAVGTIKFGGLEGDSFGSSPGDFSVVNNKLIFSAHETTSGHEFHVTDATTATTSLLKDIQPGINSSLSATAGNNPVKISNRVYFPASSLGNPIKIWKTDGNSLGTLMVDDGIADDRDAHYLKAVGNDLFFFARTGTNPLNQLWILNPLATHPARLTDTPFNGTTSTCFSYDSFVMGTVLYFPYEVEGQGCELWRSDGSSAGTFILKDIEVGTGSSYPEFLTVFDGYLYFAALQATTGYELWRTDGTLLGTTMVDDIFPGTDSGMIGEEMVELNGELYFSADDGVHGLELFKLFFPIENLMFEDGFEEIGPI